jgi:nickel/cobalt transporter (NicO) family protein
MRTFWVLLAASALAHPLGNFSVSHYARIEPTARGVEIRYVIDMAEMPTGELMREWGLDRASAPEALQRRAAEQARKWASGLTLRVNGSPVAPRLREASYTLSSGAGSLPLIRIVAELHVTATPGTFEYEDRNFDGRAGWKEIVIEAGSGARVESATQSNRDLTHALVMYPPDPSIAPPQDLRAKIVWR